MKEIILLLLFIATFLFVSGIFYGLALTDRRIRNRINYYFNINKKYNDLKKNRVSNNRHDILKSINEFIRKKLSSFNNNKVSRFLESAGVDMDPEEYVLLRWFLSAAAGGAMFLAANNLLLLILGSIVGYMLPKIWVKRKRSIRIKKFNEELPDMITTLIGSLRSGYSFSQAMKTAAEECESPIKEEIGILLQETSYGITMEEALNNLNKRMESNDLELMIQAILIQRQVGGNLSEVLEIIVKTIRERNKLERQVQTLTSQGRLSGRIIGALPVVLGFTIYFINPEFINSLFTNTIGIIMLSYGIISGIIGFILINKLTKIEV